MMDDLGLGKRSIIQVTPARCELGWEWNQADSFRSLDKARDGEPVEPLAGDHAKGVTAR